MNKEQKATTKVSKKTANKSAAANFNAHNIAQDGADIVADMKIAHIDAADELETYKKLLKKRRSRLIGRLCVFALLLIIAPVMIFLCTTVIDKNGRHDFFGYTFFVVVTNSMEPEIMVNDCVVLKRVASESDIAVGDDIGYKNSDGLVIVHRVESIETNAAGDQVYVTKGINTTEHDKIKVTFDSVVGKKAGVMRTFGNAVIFFRSTGGIVVLTLIFAAIVVAFWFGFRFTETIRYVDPVTKKQ